MVPNKHTHTHVLTHTCMYIHAHTHIYIYTHIHTYTHIYIHKYTHLHTYMYTHTHTHLHMHTHTHMHTRLRTDSPSNAALTCAQARQISFCAHFAGLWFSSPVATFLLGPPGLPPSFTLLLIFLLFLLISQDLQEN